MSIHTEEGDADTAELIQIGIIKTIDLAGPSCTVEIDGEESGPLPWLEASMGKLRIWSPPSVGEQVLVLAMDGDIGSAVVLRGLPCDAFPAAGNAEEYALVWHDGARIAYDPAAKKLTATLPSGSSIDVMADNVTITGNVSITGDVTATGTVTADTDVIGAGKSLKNHKHSAVTAGSAQSGPPA